MTRDAFVFKWRHEIGGLVLDAATAQRTGANLSVALREVMRRIDQMLATMHGELVPTPGQLPPANNGQTNPQPKGAVSK